MQFKPDDRRTTSPGIAIATTAVALALIIMLLSIAIVTGFKHEIRDKVTGFDSQIIVYPPGSTQGETESDSIRSYLRYDDALKSALERVLPAGARVNPVIQRPVIIKTEENFDGIVLKSAPAEPGFIAENITEGLYPTDFTTDSARNTIIISRVTADKLSLKPGDRVYVYLFVDDNIKTRRLTVGAIYDTHFTEFDSHLAFTSQSFLQGIDHVDKEYATALEINGLPDNEIDRLSYITQDMLVSEAAQGRLPLLNVSNVHQAGAMYFNWLSLLDTNVTVILILMALVAGFTLVSSTFIIILERVRMIGILKTMGMNNNAIRSIFIYMGVRLVARGLLIGNIAGIGVLLLQKYFNLIPLDPDVYYLNYVPVEINILSIIALNLAVIMVSTAMLLLPTRAISRMSPAKTVKFE